MQVFDDPDNLFGAIRAANEELDDQVKTANIAIYIGLVLVGLWVLAAIFLFIALCTKVKYMVLPWVVLTAIFTCFIFYNIIAAILKITGGEEEVGMPDYLNAGSSVLSALLNLYFIGVLVSYYKMDLDEATHQPIPQNQC